MGSILFQAMLVLPAMVWYSLSGSPGQPVCLTIVDTEGLGEAIRGETMGDEGGPIAPVRKRPPPNWDSIIHAVVGKLSRYPNSLSCRCHIDTEL